MKNTYNIGYKIRDFYKGIKKEDDKDRIGIIDKIDSSSTPYHIRWNNGNQGWYSESAINDIKRTTDTHLKRYKRSNELNMNEYYIVNDGFFTYYINKLTGEKKAELDENNILIEEKYDDFIR